MAAVYLPELLLHLLHCNKEHAFKELVEALIVCFIKAVLVALKEHHGVEDAQSSLNLLWLLCILLELALCVPEPATKVHPGVESLSGHCLVQVRFDHLCFLLNEEMRVLKSGL